ncbi:MULTISPECIES: hypothetical protein [unclassified Sulfurospirillum]|uniref:hypothetical protein n=1 Tax=unclassified Sulfurospirillum TaxID=2618290 RepID=UPI000502C6A0|nr:MULTISPECIES: hypothetical protein [unclassified Sulfurospirillum]KFL33061.1 hypothetical protein JU57_13120 [Sulfurospirillum sp. SCADC]
MSSNVSGVGYTIFIQSDYYANRNLEIANAMQSGEEWSSDTDLEAYIEKIKESIPELKAADDAGLAIDIVILPETASSTLKNAVNQTTQKMIDDGADEDVLKSVLGIVKYNYFSTIDFGSSGVANVTNSLLTYDKDQLSNVLNVFKDIYSSNGELSAGLSQFSDYLDAIYSSLTDTSSSSSTTTTTASSEEETSNDFVETLIQELENSEEGTTTGSEELTKKLYKDYIKSLSSNLTGGLLQQHS